MAYGKPQVKPRRSMKKIEGVKPPQPLTAAAQQGKQGTEGASEDAYPDFGRLPASGNFKANASTVPTSGGATKGFGKAPSAGGKEPSHEATKSPAHPGSHGGARTGSVDTLTKLIFHPKGGFDNKEPDVSRRHGKAPGYKDSGSRTGVHKTGVSR